MLFPWNFITVSVKMRKLQLIHICYRVKTSVLTLSVFFIDSGTPIQTLHYILSNIISGEPKDRMFLNTSVASQIIFLRFRSQFG